MKKERYKVVRNEELLKKSRNFLLKAFAIIKEDYHKRITASIKEGEGKLFSLPSDNRLITPGLIIEDREEELQKMSEFGECIKVMHTDTVISKKIDKYLITSRFYEYISPWNCLAHILKEIVNKDVFTGTNFDEQLFLSTYMDLEDLFYNNKLSVTDIAILKNFECNIDKVKLEPGLCIKRILKSKSKYPFSDYELYDLDNYSDLYYIVEWRTEEKKVFGSDPHVSFDKSKEMIRKIITALRLFKKGSVQLTHVESFPNLNTLIEPKSIRVDYFSASKSGQNYVLVKKEIRKLISLWRQISSLELDHEINLDISTSRFNSAYTKPLSEDKLIDYTISLESLFSRQGDGKDSVTHKFSLRFARLVGKTIKERKKYYEEMKHLYGSRSTVVHGKRIKEVDLHNMEEYTRIAIKRYIDEFRNKYHEHEPLIDYIDFR